MSAPKNIEMLTGQVVAPENSKWRSGGGDVMR